ncbi:hypothetical protein [Pseudoalteromonas sp.]|uniref:hypothetical protein n=1 Tax=Pseudoalteromonas sp. TaxID=53249 RepID=UPI0035649CB2
MQNTHRYDNFSWLLVCVVLLILSACSSTKNIDKSSQVVSKQQRLGLSSEELMRLKASSLQWKAAKVGVDRLLIIEQDLMLLIHQFKMATKQNPNQSKVNQLQLSSHADDITTNPALEK